MDFQLDDTIGALASAPGPSGRGIVRVSGPQARSSVALFFEPAEPAAWTDARSASAHAGLLRVPAIRSLLPVRVYVWPNTRSYTGQPLMEIHAPGSPPLLEAVLAQLFEQGVRPAVRGEFTLRAFLSGRIDLVQAEAVLGVIDADDEDHLALALKQLAGGISGRIVGVRHDLLDLLADLEAGLDFVDDDIEFVSRDDVRRRVAAAESALDDLLQVCLSRGHSAGRSRIVLAGLPNAGKSTLFNSLLARDAALVSSTAGTTRDYLRGEADWHGVAVELIDTPGWDAQRSGIMQQAHELGRDQWERSDLIVWCSPCDASPDAASRDAVTLSSLRGQNRAILLARTKADVGGSHARFDAGDVAVSAHDGVGLAELIAGCVQTLVATRPHSGGLMGTTAARCRESLVHARESLGRAAQPCESGAGDELIALEIREALDRLGRISGAVYTDDVLDRIFSRFCIGK